jgi:hypothetical protein
MWTPYMKGTGKCAVIVALVEVTRGDAPRSSAIERRGTVFRE